MISPESYLQRLRADEMVFPLKISGLSWSAARTEFQRYRDYNFPKETNAARRYLDAENRKVRYEYLKALKATGADIMADCLVGSLSFGAASLTFNSDIDATIIVRGGNTAKYEEIFDTYLADKGIKSSVDIMSQQIISGSRSKDMDLAVRAIFRFYTGISLLPRSADAESIMRRALIDVPDHILEAALNDLREEKCGEKDPVRKYKERLENYWLLFLSGRTYYQLIDQRERRLFESL